MSNSIPASFASNNSVVTTGPNGQRAHHQQFVHMERLAEGFHQVTEKVKPKKRKLEKNNLDEDSDDDFPDIVL